MTREEILKGAREARAKIEALHALWQASLEATEKLQKAFQALEAENERLNHLLDTRTRQLQNSTKYWVRASKKALDGDLKSLRMRVDLAEAGPVQWEQSGAKA